MARRSILADEDKTDINLSPMIDCIFILLIFFIVTTVFVEEQGIQVAKPDAAASVSLEEKENVVLEITADDKILFGGHEIGLSEVTAKVKSLVKDPETPVVIRADEKAHQGTFVAVWDAAKRGGAQALSFNTVN
jgi:biopolymer transport protein ExbD